jgi:hypothetical protein
MQATEAELGWFAGMLEGEGCITFFKQRRKNGKFDIITGVQITNTDINIINKLVEILRKCNLSWYIRNKKVYSKNHSQCYYIETRQQEMLKRSLELFIPYMNGNKKSKASIVLDFLIKRNGKRGNNPYTKDELTNIPRDYTSSSQADEDIVHTT